MANDRKAVETMKQIPTDGIVSGERYLAPETLDARSRKAASALHDLGVWQSDQVALLMRNDFAFLEATFGSGMLGASTVPLNWHFGAEEIAHILDDSDAKVLIAHSDLLTESVLAVCGNVHVVGVRTPPEIASAYGIDAEACGGAGRRSRVARLDFRPIPDGRKHQEKSVGPCSIRRARPACRRAVKRKPASADVIASIGRRTNAAWGFDMESIRSVMSGPLYHSAPNAYGLQVVRSGGASDPSTPIRCARAPRIGYSATKITHLHMVPTMFVRLLALPESTRSKYDLSSLSFVSHGSAPCPPDVKRRMIGLVGGP